MELDVEPWQLIRYDKLRLCPFILSGKHLAPKEVRDMSSNLIKGISISRVGGEVSLFGSYPKDTSSNLVLATSKTLTTICNSVQK